MLQMLRNKCKKRYRHQGSFRASSKDGPAPSVEIEEPLQASIIDSWFDNYLGVVSLVRVVKGKISKGDKIEIFSEKRLTQ